MIADRRKIAGFYDRALRQSRSLRPLAVPAGGVCNYYKYVCVLAERRDRPALKAALRERFGVSLAGEVYEAPLHRQPVFAAHAAEVLPVSEDLCARHICLPIFSGMTEEEARQVVQALAEVIG
jgi:dTDP-4-amino-4,6-dideoxygalactose transaminase